MAIDITCGAVDAGVFAVRSVINRGNLADVRTCCRECDEDSNTLVWLVCYGVVACLVSRKKVVAKTESQHLHNFWNAKVKENLA